MRRADRLAVFLAAGLLLAAAACGRESSAPAASAPAATAAPAYAIALHGGAGVIPKTMAAEDRLAYREGLEEALRSGVALLDEGGTSLDTVEQVIRLLEDNPRFNAGRGAVLNHEGQHELDASIMDGESLACGGVAGVRTVKHPISLARLVMERTPHVLLAGPGADRFAEVMEVERVEQDYFFTERRREQLERALERARASDDKGTVGVVALDRHGNLAAGTSTGGLTNKMYGRVGDSPIVGAGTYADNRTCAVSATGIGEEFIRHGVAQSISMLIEHGGLSLAEAAERVIHRTLEPGDGGIVAVGRGGEIAMVFNTPGMYRGAADATGRFEVRIWED